MNTERLPIVMEQAMQNWVETEQVPLPTSQAQVLTLTREEMEKCI